MPIEFHDLDIAQRARVFFNMLLEGKCCSACLLGLHASLLLMQSCNVHGERKRTIALWRTSHPIFLCPLGDITSSFSLSFGGHHIQFFFVLWRTSHPIFLCPLKDISDLGFRLFDRIFCKPFQDSGERVWHLCIHFRNPLERVFHLS